MIFSAPQCTLESFVIILMHPNLWVIMIRAFNFFETQAKTAGRCGEATPRLRRRVRYIAADGLPRGADGARRRRASPARPPRAPSGAPAVLPRGRAGLLRRARPLPLRSHGCGLGGLTAVLTAADGGRFVAAPARLLSLFAPRSATSPSRASGEATST